MKQKIQLVNSFPCYLFDIMPSIDDTKLHKNFLYETALASSIDSYKSLDNDHELLSLIEYLDRNTIKCDLELLSSLEDKTNIAWSSEPESMQDLQQILEMISENLRYVQMASDKNEAVETLKRKLNSSMKP